MVPCQTSAFIGKKREKVGSGTIHRGFVPLGGALMYPRPQLSSRCYSSPPGVLSRSRSMLHFAFLRRYGVSFLTPGIFDEMGPDVHDCLRTFRLHPAPRLPLRPSHVKCVMRLRSTLAQPLRIARKACVHGTNSHLPDGTGNTHGGDRARGKIAVRHPCEHAQHLAWLLLTSACLSKVPR